MDQLPAPRPSIGLALGGGVARGWAHIGVLRTLIKAGLEPDILAGSSSGGVVAAAYATGHLDDLEAWTRSLSPRRIRGLVDLVWNGQAVIGGERLAETLTAYMGTATFETTARPLTLIGTELSTGHEVWLQRGPIVPAVQASYALPGVFAPVTIDGRALIDGAIVNPCPISAVRAMGARIVIAVTLHASEAEQPMAIPSFAPAADEQRERMRLAMPESFSPKRFLLRQFFLTLPEELSESARLEGASEFAILGRIILPLSKPALAVVILFRFLWSWNDYLGPLIYINQENLQPLALMIYRLRTIATSMGTSAMAYPHLMAVSTLVALPIILAFVLAQRTFIEGISMTGLKG